MTPFFVVATEIKFGISVMFGLMIIWGTISCIAWYYSQGVWMTVMSFGLWEINHDVFAWIDHNIDGPVVFAVLVFFYGMGYSTNGGASVNRLIDDDLDYMG